MTTEIPTSNPAAGVAGFFPEGLPDEASLSELASQIFRLLPGTSLPQVPAAVASPPVALEDLPAAPVNSPRVLPSSAAPNGAPDVLAQSVPAYGLPTGGEALSVPEAAAPQLPHAGHAPYSPPGTPYYFLGEAAGLAPPGTPAGTRAEPRAFGPPGEQELAALLAELTLSSPPHVGASPGLAHPGAGGQDFYFLQSPVGVVSEVPLAYQDPHPAFDVNAVRRDFPILEERVNGRQLVWFDNAATTQKPQAVIDRLNWFYAHESSNIHRAAHELAARSTDAYEGARNKVARFLGAASTDEIIFVRGATEAINLVAQTYGKQFIGEGDEIVVSHLEHHANIVPWQQIASEKGAKIRVIPVDDTGQILLDEYQKLLNGRTKLVAIAQVSNALGTITPVKEIIDLAHNAGAVVLVDGAQSVSHLRVNVQALDADFFVFSGHKIFGPTGIGVVYGKKKILDTLPPWQGGGNMIEDVTFERTLYNPAPARFEAGTGNIADAVGLGAALDYLERIGLENVARYEHDLLDYAANALATIKGLRPIGTAKNKTSVLSFVLAGHSTVDVGKALNVEGIAVRAGHHCAQPILRRFGVEATVRPSIAFYNTCEEVDRMIAVLRALSRS